MPTPGLVFAHQRIAPPVVADFGAAPVAANELKPLHGLVLVGRGAGQVVVRFAGGEPSLFDSAFIAQNDQGAGKGEIGRAGFDGEGMEAAGFNAPMAGLGMGKKGVACSASKPRACSRSLA